MIQSAKFLRYAILIPTFLFQACIPSLSKGFLQSITDFIQLRTLVNPAPTGPYYVSATVSGLLGSGLVLDLNSGSEIIVVNADGTFQFKTALNTGNNFNVTITTQPTLPVQTCSVSGGMGVVAYGNINSIIVNCDPLRYTVGGTITGLDGITGLVLTNSVDGSTLNVAVASGSFAFTQTYLDGTSYNVSVTTQPNHPVQNCLTTNGSGTIAGANITNITIACNSIAFPIEVTAVGIASGTLSIRNNNSELLTITTNGLHRFPTNIITNNTYSLQIVSTPANHHCVLSATGGTVTGTISITANCFSVLSFNPSNGGILQPTESLKLQFSAAINAGSCVGSTGTLNTVMSLAIQFAVSTTSITNDTLIVSPAATDSWQTGHKILTLNCNSVSGHPLSSTVNILYLIPSNIRYVSDSGNDLNNGLTPTTPKRNIQLAIDDFGGCGTGDCAVLVEDGSYDPAFAGAGIQLVSGISLYGGYQPTTSFSVWRPNLHGSVILMDTTPPGCSVATITSPCASIIGDATVTTNVTISGFRIQSGPDIAPFMAGVFLDSTNNVRLINNEIDGGVGTNGVAGVHAINSSPYLIQNVIIGGLCTAASCDSVGVYMSTSVPISPIILANSISGGTPTGSGVNSRGIRYAGTAAMTVTNIVGNLITSKNLNKATSLFSIGFDINSGTGLTGTLAGNIITGGEGGTSIGLRVQSATTIQIGSPTQGNQITSSDATTGTYGLYLTGGQTVRRNVIRFGTAMSAAVAIATGIYATGGGTQIIESNSIQDGNVSSTGATATLNGIYSANASAASSIAGNYIRIGRSEGVTSTATTTAGISLNTPQNALIANNWIQNGTSDVNARGLELKSVFSGLRIYHNTVSSGTGVSNETPVFISSGSSTIDIQNNILLLNNDSVSNACIYNAGIGIQAAVKYNVLHNCANLVIQNALNYDTLCAGGIPGALGCVTPLGIASNFGNNLKLDPNLVLNFGVISIYTPTTATSCLITKSTNALLTDSYNGAGTRPGTDGAVSLGAVEYDQACTP